MVALDPEVLEAAAALHRKARVLAGLPAAHPHTLSTSEISRVAEAMDCEVFYFRFQSGAAGMALPALRGRTPLFVDSGEGKAVEMLSVRHEIAHALAGDAGEGPVMLADGDEMGHAERVADLFAVADLVPARWMRHFRGGRRAWKHVELDVQLAFRELTEGWSTLRLRDRARLRVALYRTHGV